MSKIRSLALAAASLTLVVHVHAASFANEVINYNAGVDFVPGFTDPLTALGEPSRVTPGAFGGPVDPFNPAYLKGQIVSLGAGGTLTVRLGTPVFNDPTHLFGTDLLIFGNAGFIITNTVDVNFNFIGTPATDGSLFAANDGHTRVSVSADGVTFYTLNPALAPTVDGLFPTDGTGDLQKPVNPALNNASFGGKTLDDIRALYAGSGGGAGFDLAWAQDANGQSVNLDAVNFVRVDVLEGKSEIDGFVVVPEPATWGLALLGVGIGFAARRRK